MILILGANGQLGSALLAKMQRSPGSWGEVRGFTRSECDLEQIDTLQATLDRYKPRVIINAAAYTAVDLAEDEQERAHRINAVAPGFLAQWCMRNEARLVHFSTDYVFDGSGKDPHREDEDTAPLSVYGKTKRAGEIAIVESGCMHMIFRCSWIYDAHGKNFLRTMLRLGAEKETLRIVADQIGAPSYAPHLADAVLTALDRVPATFPYFPSGIYHLCHQGSTSWHGFALAIFAAAAKKRFPLKVNRVDAIASSEYPQKAPRPKNSRLDISKAHKIFGIKLPSWEEGLHACMEEIR